MSSLDTNRILNKLITGADPEGKKLTELQQKVKIL